MERISIAVAGATAPDVAKTIVDYLAAHVKTIKGYDGRAGSAATLTPELIKSTRRPLMGSRISREEERWFLDQPIRTALDAVSRDGQLVDVEFSRTARGAQAARLDEMGALWLVFSEHAPRGISWAKISKCLYLLRPGLYPILDSRLSRRYRPIARGLTAGEGSPLSGPAVMRVLVGFG